MNIGIIGAGSASAVAILAIANKRLSDPSFFQSLHITCISDSNIPITQVGESISPSIIAIMEYVLGLDFLQGLPNFDGTPRYYSKYFLSEQGGENFHTWHMRPGAHVNSQKFSRFIIDSIKKRHEFFTEINDTVIDITNFDSGVIVNCKENSYKFDYLIDCRGSPSKEELESGAYITDPFESVNSVILFPDFKKYEEPFTSVHFHDNGWMFGVPLQHRKAWGYLYNNNVTTKEEACEGFSKLKGIDTNNLTKFSWKPYYKKNAVEGRILSLGNRLYFFEPQHAIPLHYYLNLTAQFVHEIIYLPTDRLNYMLNNFHLEQMEQIQNLIALNYIRDPGLNTSFWNYIRPKAVEKLKTSKNFQKWIVKCQTHNRLFDYFTHDSFIIKFYLDGYGINLNDLKNKDSNYFLN